MGVWFHGFHAIPQTFSGPLSGACRRWCAVFTVARRFRGETFRPAPLCCFPRRSYPMRRLILSAAAALCVGAPLLCPAQTAAARTHAKGNPEDGHTVYQHACVMCHSTQPGVKIVGPSLAGVLKGPARGRHPHRAADHSERQGADAAGTRPAERPGDHRSAGLPEDTVVGSEPEYGNWPEGRRGDACPGWIVEAKQLVWRFWPA